MKKKILAVMLSVMLAGTFAACGNKDADDAGAIDTEENKPEEEGQQEAEDQVPDKSGAADAASDSGPKYLLDYTAGDYVTLGEYKGIEINTDELLQQWIDYTLSSEAETVEVTDRSVEIGDTANIDYEGKLDGVAFEGGTAQGADLVIGSGSFIEGFEEGVVGMKIGETKDIHLSFPDSYRPNPDLAGQPVVFTVTVNSITMQQIPELTDEYVAGLELEECSTVEEYRDYLYEFMLEQEAFQNQKANLVIERVMESAVFKDMPEGMLNRMYENLLNTASAYASVYGMSVGDYITYVYGGTADQYEEVLMGQAELVAQHYILMGAIAEEEGIEITDAELEESITAEAAGYAGYGYESEEAYREAVDMEAYKEYLLVEKVTDFLGENAVLVSENN